MGGFSRLTHQIASLPRSPVRIRMTSSTDESKGWSLLNQEDSLIKLIVSKEFVVEI
jgi:hypothetical protein